MLNPSYQSPEKNSKTSEICALKHHFESKNLQIEVEISSASVWSFIWNMSEDSFSGVLELNIRPRLIGFDGVVQHEQWFGRTFRIEKSLINKLALKEHFVKFLCDEINSLSIQ